MNGGVVAKVTSAIGQDLPHPSTCLALEVLRGSDVISLYF